MNITLLYMAHEIEARSFRANMNTINKRIVNLMTSCRLYNDQTSHHFNELFGDKSIEAVALKKEKSRHFDANIEYRTMEALRNYVQHRGYPVSDYSLASKWLKKTERTQTTT
jgi:hypothetical protein